MAVSHSVHLKFDQIDAYIYIGTTICCKRHFNALISMGIKADIDLQEEKEDKPSGVLAFLWLPTADFTAPTQAQLTIGIHFIDELVKRRMKVYVHCNEGHGRAPTLVAAYYIYKGMTPKQSIDFIKSKRLGIKPNKKQRHALDVFSEHIKKQFI